MTESVIKALGNMGVAYRGEYEGLSLFEGVGNGYKAAVDLSEMDGDDAISEVTRQFQLRREDWIVAAEVLNTVHTSVPMRIGPQGGFHVLIDGQWLRVRKET